MTDLILSGPAIEARHNHNRWVVDCPRCTSAMGVPRTIATPDELFDIEGRPTWNVVFQVGEHETRCMDCGAYIGPIVWPADPVGIETILSYRPDPETRSWDPGETLEDLIAENLAHDVVPPEWLEAAESDPQLLIAEVVDQRLNGGLMFQALPAADPRRALATARAAAHDIGVSFIEDDGTLSFPGNPELEG